MILCTVAIPAPSTNLIGKALDGVTILFSAAAFPLSGSLAFGITPGNLAATNGACFYMEWTQGGIKYYSEQLKAVAKTDFYKIEVTNNKSWLDVPAGQTIVTTYRAEFWQQRFPQEIENIEIVPGKFTRLRNEQRRQIQFYTDYQTDANHEHLKILFSFDSVKIANVGEVPTTEYIMEESYEHTPIKKYALSRGMVWLTEQPTIIRNVI
jgi:hypothetical protein